MGTSYVIYLYDEYDWGYVNFDKREVVKQMESVYPGCDVIASFRCCIIFNIYKNWPPDCVGKVTADDIFFTDDLGQITPMSVIKRFGISEPNNMLSGAPAEPTTKRDA